MHENPKDAIGVAYCGYPSCCNKFTTGALVGALGSSQKTQSLQLWPSMDLLRQHFARGNCRHLS